jgi:protein-L-isoaspartate(D-aspartate) O-methyltransferase
MLMNERHLATFRRHMVELIEIQVEIAADELGKDSLDPRVMATMAVVPRHEFVPPPLRAHAYENSPLPIGMGKTISQPFIVAVMTDLLDTRPEHVVLEIGTGLGYQAAILADLVGHVWSVEIVEELATEAEARLADLGIANVTIRVGDGSHGWAEHAPFDRILVAAAAPTVPPDLVKQLRPGGRLVMPTGRGDEQKITVVDKDASGRSRERSLLAVRFSELETVR